MNEIIKEVRSLLEDSCKLCKSQTIAMSGGLDSSIITFLLKDRKPKGVTLISEDFVATDLTYCQMISKNFDVPLEIIKASTAELLSGADKTVKILGNFNDIEIRNNLVIFLVMDWVKKKGENSIITGDGADELFAGYKFLINKSEKDLDDEIERIRNIMHFPSQKIAKYLGISIETPFLNEKIVELSKKIPSSLKVSNQGDKRYGKWILQKAFEDEIPSQIIWREKSPMQDGAGTVGLTDLFDSWITDDMFSHKIKEIKENEGVLIRTKESLYYYEIYRKYYDVPAKIETGNSKCPFCSYRLDENSRFCRMCGAFPI